MMILGFVTFLLVAGSSLALNLGFLSDVFSAQPVPQCEWEMMKYAEQNPAGWGKICRDNYPVYDEQLIQEALKVDYKANYVLKHIIKMYQPMQDTYFGNELGFRTVDMCAATPEHVVRVNVSLAGRQVICNVVEPEQQNIYTATCLRSCRYGNETNPQDMCVPDGFINRYAVVFCPSLLKQCQIVELNLPVGCSCKRYTCLKSAPALF